MFLDERITEKILYGSDITDSFRSPKHEVYSGHDHRKLLDPYVLFRSDMLTLDMDEILQRDVIKFFRKTAGGFKSFRVKNPYDFSTNDSTGIPTYNDGRCEAGVGVYHITSWYGDDTESTAARRRVKKPLAGTVLVGIRDDLNNPHQIVKISTDPAPDVVRYTVDYTTGEISFTANSQNVITNITLASQAVITLGVSHGRVVDDSVHISSVVGMVEINGLRGTITAVDATTVTVDIDSSQFTPYGSGGVTNTAPQPSEEVTAGCYFDIPCVFQESEMTYSLTNYKILSASVGVIETYHP